MCYHKLKMNQTARGEAEIAGNTFIDISQNSDRLPLSCGAPCLTGSAHLFSLDKRAMMSKASYLIVHGWPEDMLDGISEADAASLGGDAWCLPVMGLVATACWMCPHADWWRADAAPDRRKPVRSCC